MINPTKKITFLSANSFDATKPMENRLMSFIHEALHRNYDVTLITPDRAEISIKNSKFKHVALNISNNKNNNIFKRALRELYISYKVYRSAAKIKKSTYFLSIPSPLPLFFLRFFQKDSLIIDVRDITWGYLPERNNFQKILKKISSNIFNFLLSHSKRILVTNNAEKEYFLNVFGNKKNIEIFPNGISNQNYQILHNIENASDKPVVGYFGALGKAQNVAELVFLAEKNSKVQFLISGSGSEYQHIQNLIDRKKLLNVTLTERLSWTELLERYKQTNIFFAQLTDDYCSAIPSKLYEYLSTGKPIIYFGKGEAERFLKNFENCIIVNDSSLETLNNKLCRLIASGKYQEVSKFNKSRIEENYLRDNFAKTFFDNLY